MKPPSRTLLPALCALALLRVTDSTAQDVNILEEGAFESSKGGEPTGFQWAGFAGDPSITPNRFELASDPGTPTGQYARITVPNGTNKQIATLKLREPILLPPEWIGLGISVKLRIKDYQQGAEPWHGVKVFARFKNLNNEAVGGDAAVISVKESVAEWRDYANQVVVPTGATQAVIEVGLWGSAGVLEIDDLRVTPVRAPAPSKP